MDHPDVFLSYSEDASEIVTRIENFLGSRGRAVYSFRREQNPFGEEIRKRLRLLIQRSRYVLVVISPKARLSEWVAFEIQQAKDSSVPVVPVRGPSVSSDEMPPASKDWPWIDFGETTHFESELEDADQRWGHIDVYLPAGGYPGTKIEFSEHVPKALFPVGDRPMLFHVLESLAHRAFGKAVIINRNDVCWQYIKYLTTLNAELPVRVDFQQFARADVPDWPWALKTLSPSRTFVLQLCDVLLCLHGEFPEEVIQRKWQHALSQHWEGRRQYGTDYLGTLLVSEDYNLSVGTVKFTFDGSIQKVHDTGENPRIQELGRYFVNTGTAILEPGILEFVERDDASLHGDAIRRAREANKVFGVSVWGNWHHALNINDYAITHRAHMSRSDGEGSIPIS